MDGATATPPPHGHPLWVKILAGLAVAALLLALLIVFFPWDVLRGPLNRYVSDRTGRHFEITRKLDVKVGRTTRILADGITFANPEWANDPLLVKAEGAQIDVELLPLLRRHIVIPRIELREPQLGLQTEPDGRRSWALGRDTGDPANIPDIGALVVDKGTAHYVAPEHGADIHIDFAIDGPLTLPPKPGETEVAQGNAMPLSFKAKGKWEKEPFTAQGRTGNVLYLSAPLQNPFPIEVQATAGSTSLRARGAIASLATLDGANASFDLKGKNLSDLYKLVGVVLPSTPHYAVRGRVAKQGEFWRLREIDGKLGDTDIKGELSYDRAQKVPHLAGKLRSNLLDFDDLAPIIGLPEQPSKPASVRVAQAEPEPKKGLLGGTRKPKVPRDPNRKVLPKAPLDLARLKAMNSEVAYSAAKVVNARWFPLERGSVNIRLKDGVLNLDPMNLGIAGGTVAGKLRIDSHVQPAATEVHLNARSMELSKMFKDVNLTRTSFGKIHGDIDLKGRGNSVAQVLAASSGNVAMLMGKGQISNLLLEVLGLDGAEIIKFLVRGDTNVPVRCAASAFDVKNGLMTSRALMIDSTDTVIYGDGNVNFANEALDLYFRPYPKDMSILSLRSPLKVTGTLGAPHAGPDKGALAGRAGIALALGAINPLLALAATVETGPGEDANCSAILRDAASPGAAARVDALSQHQQRATAELGGPPRRAKSR
jgi:AsmA family protein